MVIGESRLHRPIRNMLSGRIVQAVHLGVAVCKIKLWPNFHILQGSQNIINEIFTQAFAIKSNL